MLFDCHKRQEDKWPYPFFKTHEETEAKEGKWPPKVSQLIGGRSDIINQGFWLLAQETLHSACERPKSELNRSRCKCPQTLNWTVRQLLALTSQKSPGENKRIWSSTLGQTLGWGTETRVLPDSMGWGGGQTKNVVSSSTTPRGAPSHPPAFLPAFYFFFLSAIMYWILPVC